MKVTSGPLNNRVPALNGLLRLNSGSCIIIKLFAPLQIQELQAYGSKMLDDIKVRVSAFNWSFSGAKSSRLSVKGLASIQVSQCRCNDWKLHPQEQFNIQMQR